MPEPAIEAPDLPLDEPVIVTQFDDFQSTELDSVYQWLRTPYPEKLFSLHEEPGKLRLYGMESPGSLYEQALIARRQTDFVCEATTAVDFEPESFLQLAGLICYYNSCKFHYLYISTDDDIGKHIGIMSCEANRTTAVSYPIHENRVSLPKGSPVWLRASVNNARLVFSWSVDGDKWQEIPVELDQSLLSDEAGINGGEQFTGAFVGMTCNDLSGRRKHADFDFFNYAGKDSD